VTKRLGQSFPYEVVLRAGSREREMRPCRLWVTCGRRPGKRFSDISAALVGCGHVSGLLMRRMWPLALMLCADRVPIVSMHLEVR
jgi:hypothetical protein